MSSAVLINQMENKSGIVVYPNPAHDVIEIYFESPFETIEILDLQGQIIKKESVSCTSKKTLSIGVLPPGMYFVKVVNEKEQIVKKLIVE
jgi:hypothetical protein